VPGSHLAEHVIEGAIEGAVEGVLETALGVALGPIGLGCSAVRLAAGIANAGSNDGRAHGVHHERRKVPAIDEVITI
jgi:hypothetical protein